MQKQLSKKSHKPTESSIDDFMKHIRKYNLQSQLYITPKPLLYMYTNPSRHYTLQTLQKSRSKSKTLSNRQHSNSKKATSKNLRQKVEKMLSITKKQNMHKKSASSISKKNQKSIRKLNKSTAQMDLTKSKQNFKSKLNEFKLKPMTVSNKKVRKSKTKFQQYRPKFTQRSPIHQNQLSSQIDIIQQNQQNPAQLIQVYSKKLLKVQLYLQANKNKLGSMLCKKFQQILNQIVQLLVKNLKKSLDQLEVDIEKRLIKKFQSQFDKSMMQKQQQIRTMEKICQKITNKFADLLHKQNYSNSLIYGLRRKGIDIDNQFGLAVWGVDTLGGLGYTKHQQSQNQDHSQTSQNPHLRRLIKQEENIIEEQNDQSSQEDEFQFRQHPNQKLKRQININRQKHLQQHVEKHTKYGQQLNRNKYIDEEQDQFSSRQQKEYQFRIRQYTGMHEIRKSL